MNPLLTEETVGRLEIAAFGHAFDSVCKHCGKWFEDHGVSKNQCPAGDHWAETTFEPEPVCRHCGRASSIRDSGKSSNAFQETNSTSF